MINPFLLFLLLLFTLSLAGCAILPNVSDKIQEARATQKSSQILSAKGWLSSKQSKVHMDRLRRSVDPTDLGEKTFAFQDPGAIGPSILPLALKIKERGQRFLFQFA
jgi:hypothetical protein